MKVLVELNLEVDIPEDSLLAYEKATKEWLWTERRDEILQAMRISRLASVSPSKSYQTYDTPKKLLLLDSIARAQRQYLLMQEVSEGVFGADSEERSLTRGNGCLLLGSCCV
jgi:hypothetical protein